MKKKILVIGITMAAAGSEKSFLSFAGAIDYEKYDVDLLLAKKSGDFLPLVPKEIRILEMGRMGELFLLDRRNAKRIILTRYLARNPFRAFGLVPYFLRMKGAESPEARSFAANRMWLAMMRKMPDFEGEYDIALAYWGDRTMFYMIDKVTAKKKIAWLHFDYSHPPREDALYLSYFKRCDKVVTVSREIEKSLKSALPEISDKIVTLENIINRREILALASEPADFGDDFDGIRLLTVGRICPQKGYDLAVPAVARLIREGYPIRWYIVGRGEEGYVRRLEAQIREKGISDEVRFLGVRQNPYSLMRAADLYVQPSRHDGKPIAVEEAKVLCKPIFVTAYTSAAEQLKGGRLGLIGDISEEGIYQGLKKMLDERDFRESLQKNLEELTKKEEKNSAFMDILE